MDYVLACNWQNLSSIFILETLNFQKLSPTAFHLGKRIKSHKVSCVNLPCGKMLFIILKNQTFFKLVNIFSCIIYKIIVYRRTSINYVLLKNQYGTCCFKIHAKKLYCPNPKCYSKVSLLENTSLFVAKKFFFQIYRIKLQEMLTPLSFWYGYQNCSWRACIYGLKFQSHVKNWVFVFFSYPTCH